MKYWDKAWQLIDGCSPVSAGCDNCWSAGMTHRFKQGLTYDKGKFTGEIITREDKLSLPLNTKKTKKTTVWSVWNDLFLASESFIWSAINTMRLRPQHTFLILTKRIEKAAQICSFLKFPLPNHIWIGASIENQQTADERIPHLLQILGKKFLSIEPMMGNIDLKLNDEFPDQDGCYEDARHNIAQVICGGETGPHARPCHPDWVRSIRDQCQEAGVPFLFKGWGEWGSYCERKKENKKWILQRHIPTKDKRWGTLDLQGNWFENTTPWNGRQEDDSETGEVVMVRVGHKAAGRLLDGVEHNDLAWRKL